MLVNKSAGQDMAFVLITHSTSCYPYKICTSLQFIVDVGEGLVIHKGLLEVKGCWGMVIISFSPVATGKFPLLQEIVFNPHSWENNPT